MTTLAERLFEDGAEAETIALLQGHGVPFVRIGWDSYDDSLELHGVPAAYRLPAETQRALHAAGFMTVFVNHVDKWETHYSAHGGAFRVSYPDRRGDGEKSIWVEERVEGWPAEWFDTGYVVIRPAKETA